MSKKRRMFDIDLPEADVAPLPPDLETKSMDAPRRGPMATAIGENADALRRRATIEADIRAENDALAHEFVRLKKLGLIVDMIPVDAVRIAKLVRDRSRTANLDLTDLKASILAVGLSNPIRVEPDGKGGYELVQGLRRLSAWRELRAETGDGSFDMIPAGLMATGETIETLYRRMVDENLIRKDVSFAEMANLARAYADDAVDDCADLDEAVNRLYASASPQKRSYIRRFAFLMRVLEKQLEHPAAIPRALGLQLADRIEADPAASAVIARMLTQAGKRSAEEEVDVLRRFVAGQSSPLPTKVRGAPKGGRRGRVSLTVPVGPAGVRCTATDGKMELRADLDFSTLDRERLEAAIEAFFDALEKR
ncbi:MAG: replication protein [Cereibacter sphaeroides]|uniref:Replication protein n=1 Tax=Cereibacter sphaeroides TaxID=1063 RepID=A0A2W5UDK1_CERSP|nr:MAG: replication protein [Cereibacter sphaeroides]